MSKLRDQGVRAVNQDFNRFEQVRKRQRYRLAEQQGGEAFDDDYVIETCDMSALLAGEPGAETAFAHRLGSALEDIGFAILVGHGVDPAVQQHATRRCRALFEGIPEAGRQPYLARRVGSINQGYFPLKQTTLIHPDLVEGWVFCRRAFNLAGDPAFEASAFWPQADYELDFRPLVQAQERLILPIMQSLLRYLGCDPHSYDQRLTGTNFGLRLNYYPPLRQADRESGAGRMLGHEDVDLFTFLPAPEVDGLQVLNRRNMKWIRLQAPPGSIILNTGDYMQRISNDRLPSTTHRVALPVDRALHREARVSLPMAIYLWEHEMLEVLPGTGEPRYPPISAIRFHTAITSKYYGDDYAVGEGE